MNKNKSYKCIKSFEIPILDENGSCTDDFLIIKKNALFNFEGSNTLCGADVNLYNVNNLYYYKYIRNTNYK
ncbi:MAG: hypothetical protein B6I28_06450 [Fusobacteriia bacterium 4572_132]|nr:MAG: hypothetical protein B6I28_06450 [Fusobacteriia bacterium 4572_132]